MGGVVLCALCADAQRSSMCISCKDAVGPGFVSRAAWTQSVDVGETCWFRLGLGRVESSGRSRERDTLLLSRWRCRVRHVGVCFDRPSQTLQRVPSVALSRTGSAPARPSMPSKNKKQPADPRWRHNHAPLKGGPNSTHTRSKLPTVTSPGGCAREAAASVR